MVEQSQDSIAAESRAYTHPQTVFAAIDGSEASDLAFSIAKNGILREGTDRLVVGHIRNDKKEYLPWNMKSTYIHDMFETRIMDLGKMAEFAMIDLEEGKTTKECLWALAQERKASIIVTGMHGRKGLKADLTVAGTAVQYLALYSTIPILVVKDPRHRRDRPNNAYRFGVLFDGSEKSKKALVATCKLMAHQDKLVVITVNEDLVDEKNAHSQVPDIAAKYGVMSVEKVMLDHPKTLTVYQVIKQYLGSQVSDEPGCESDYIDFVAVGNSGLNFNAHEEPEYLGQVAGTVLRAKRMNCLFIP